MKKKSVLWKIQKDNCIPSFLVGTMHVKDEHAFRHIDKIMTAMSKCTQFRTEIDLDDAIKSQIQSHYIIPDNLLLTDLIGPKKFHKMRKIVMKAFNIELLHFNNYLPVLTLNIISESLMNAQHALPLDHHLWMEAKSRKMDIAGIERVERQIEVLKKLPLEPQIKMLKELCKNPQKFKKGLKRLVKMYLEEDIHALYILTKKNMGAFRKLLIYERNLDMANCISMNRDTPCLYAIGAAHLSGEKGVLSLLRKEGFVLRPIP